MYKLCLSKACKGGTIHTKGGQNGKYGIDYQPERRLYA